MSLIDDLKQLDFKQPGMWPWPIKAAAFLVIFIAIQVAAYFAFWQAQADEIEKGRNDVAKQKEVFLEKKKLAVNLEAYKQQRAEIEQSFGALLKQLPNKSEMDALLIDITDLPAVQVGDEAVLLGRQGDLRQRTADDRIRLVGWQERHEIGFQGTALPEPHFGVIRDRTDDNDQPDPRQLAVPAQGAHVMSGAECDALANQRPDVRPAAVRRAR